MAQSLPTFEPSQQIIPAATLPSNTIQQAADQIGTSIGNIGQTLSRGIIFNQMEQAKKQKAAQAKIVSANYQTRLNNSLYVAGQTGQADPNEVSWIVNAKPQNSENVLNDLNLAKWRFTQRKSIEAGTINQIKASMSSLQSPSADVNVDDSNAFAFHQARLKLASELKAHLNSIQEDPVGAFQNDPTVQGEIADVKTTPGFNGFLPAIQQSMMSNAIAKGSVNVQLQKGILSVNTQGLSVGEARSEVSLINQLPIGDQPQAIKTFLIGGNDAGQTFDPKLGGFNPSVRMSVLNSLTKGGLRSATQGMMTIATNKQFSYLAPQLAIAYQTSSQEYNNELASKNDQGMISISKINQSIGTDSLVKQAFSAYTASGSKGFDAYAKLKSDATLLTTQLMLGPNQMSFSDAKTTAENAMFGNVQYSGTLTNFFENNGQTFFFPKEVNGLPVDPGRVRLILGFLKNEVATSKNMTISENYRRTLPGEVADQDVPTLISKTGMMTNDSTGNGLTFKDSWGTQPLFGGQPLTVSFQEIADPNSQLNRNVDAWMARRTEKLRGGGRFSPDFTKRMIMSDIERLNEVSSGQTGQFAPDVFQGRFGGRP